MSSSISGLISSGCQSIYRAASNNPISSAIIGIGTTIFTVALIWNCRKSKPQKTALSLEEKAALLEQMDKSSPLYRGVAIRYFFDRLRSLGAGREGVETAQAQDLIQIMSEKPSNSSYQSLVPVTRVGPFDHRRQPIPQTRKKIDELNPTDEELARYVDNPSYDVYAEAKRTLRS